MTANIDQLEDTTNGIAKLDAPSNIIPGLAYLGLPTTAFVL